MKILNEISNLVKRIISNLHKIPFGNLREQLFNLCKHYGIIYKEQEESYTSKASFFDNDQLPKWHLADETEHQFTGKRKNVVYTVHLLDMNSMLSLMVL